MKLFSCEKCGQPLHFENSRCLNCSAYLGFLPGSLKLSALTPGQDGSYSAASDPGRYQPCANATHCGCNWMVPESTGESFCEACALNQTIPDLDIAGNSEKWQDIETAKRRLIYALLRFDLPLKNRAEDREDGLAFDFLADEPDKPVMTGHDDGLITINIAEADSAERERRRIEMGESYRTLLGHFRHEVGHYYWNLLVLDRNLTGAARSVFGDERVSYAEALEEYYRTGPAPGWQNAFVSAYATMHPWEDFAETWTHYFHMVDTLDTAASFGMTLNPVATPDQTADAPVPFDPYRAFSCDALVSAWLPLTVAVNSLNRSMGQSDLYPFTLSNAAIDKLSFIHGLVRGTL